MKKKSSISRKKYRTIVSNKLVNWKKNLLLLWLPFEGVELEEDGGLHLAAICIGPQKFTGIVMGCNIKGVSGVPLSNKWMYGCITSSATGTGI